jgi:hypothetical protein
VSAPAGLMRMFMSYVPGVTALIQQTGRFQVAVRRRISPTVSGIIERVRSSTRTAEPTERGGRVSLCAPHVWRLGWTRPNPGGDDGRRAHQHANHEGGGMARLAASGTAR